MSLTTTPGYVRCAMPFGVNDHCDFAANLFRVARKCLSTGRLDDALPLLQRATEQLPEVSEYWLALAIQYPCFIFIELFQPIKNVIARHCELTRFDYWYCFFISAVK